MDVTALSFELFAICVKVCKLLLEASDMPKSSRYLHVRLRMERDKLVNWAVLANLSEDERSLNSGLRLNKHKVNGTLQEIRLVLLEITKLSRRLELGQGKSHRDTGSTNDTSDIVSLRFNSTLQRKAVAFIIKTRNFPERLRWAVFDNMDFEMLLAKLTALNDGMLRFFERHQQEEHFQMQLDTFMGILQANDKFEDLMDLMASLKATTTYTITPAHEQRLFQLARFKTFRIAIGKAPRGFSEESVKSHMGDPPECSSEIRLDTRRLRTKAEPYMARESQRARTSGTYESTPVWIEWKYYEPVGEQADPPRYVEDRICKLATLLRYKHKPEEFRVMNCLGYIHQPENYRFGFVFEALLEDYVPSSLLDWLTPPNPKPSLTTRIQIARDVATSIWYLHATNWLHKGLRSENVVFQSFVSTGPYLVGLDYSRPANPYELTGKAAGNLCHDLYRHPSTQFDFPRDGPSEFKKLYDIYSLGVVLYEIGMWKPIHEILGISLDERIRPADVKAAQTRLLSQEKLMSLAGEVGDKYMLMVASCLSGDFGFNGFDQGFHNHQGNYDARLQLEFGERVIRTLNRGITV